MRSIFAALALASLVACGTPSTDGPQAGPSATGAPAPDQKYVGQGMVLQEGEKAPEFCLGGVADSLPPQCGGPELVGWDWDAVEGEESAGGTTWGSYQLTGYYDGTTFTVLLTSPPQEYPGQDDSRFETPCTEPPGGWKADDPERATEADRSVAIEYAESQPEHAATWVDYIDDPSEFTEPKDMILNIAFTENAERHEAEIRKLWGGPLCVIEKEGHTRAELSEIQNSDWAKDFGLEVLYSSLNEVEGNVELGVVVIDDDTKRAIDERYGPGTVVVIPALEPVE